MKLRPEGAADATIDAEMLSRWSDDSRPVWIVAGDDRKVIWSNSAAVHLERAGRVDMTGARPDDETAGDMPFEPFTCRLSLGAPFDPSVEDTGDDARTIGCVCRPTSDAVNGPTIRVEAEGFETILRKTPAARLSATEVADLLVEATVAPAGAWRRTLMAKLARLVENAAPWLRAEILILPQSPGDAPEVIAPSLGSGHEAAIQAAWLDGEELPARIALEIGRARSVPPTELAAALPGLLAFSRAIRSERGEVGGVLTLYSRADPAGLLDAAEKMAAAVMPMAREPMPRPLRSAEAVHAQPVMIAEIDTAGRFCAMNDAFCDALRLSRPASLGQRLDDLFGEDGAAPFERILNALRVQPTVEAILDEPAGQGRKLTVTAYRREPDDRAVLVATSLTPAPPLPGGSWYRGAEDRFRTVFDLAPVGLCIDRLRDGTVVDANPAMARLYGYRPEDFGTLVYWDELAPETVEQEKEALDLLRRQGWHGPLPRRAMRPDGSSLAVLISAVLIAGPEGEPMILSAVQDLSERKRAEEKLRTLTERVEMALQLTGAGLFIYDIEADTLDADKRMLEIYGLTDAPPPKPTPRGFWSSFVHPEDRDKARERFADARQGKLMRDHEHRIYRADGELRVVRIASQLIRKDGRPTHVVAINMDVTEERRTLEAREAARRAAEDANRAKTRFLANISHELRTPLNGILGVAQLLEATGESAKMRDYGALIRAAGDTLLPLVEDLLDLASIESGQMRLDRRQVELAPLAQSAIDTVRGAAEAKGLGLSFEIGRGVPDWIETDGSRLRQVLVNLLANAVKYTEAGSVGLRIERDGGDLERTPDDPGGVALRFLVCDTGPGIDPADHDTIFQRFMQGPSSSGTLNGGVGLGLAIAREVVEQMGGRIGVESAPGRGSVFWVALTVPPVDTDM
ncbi:MAG: PAS domain S-box protein [Paracoccaceae bacterium]